MPVKIPDDLPAREILNGENIFIMGEGRAQSQDIRPLQILILNLMPNKIETETQLLRLLGNNPLQVEITLLYPSSHKSRNTSQEHLRSFYRTFAEIRKRKYDGLVITGAPVEHLDFEEVDFWEELQEIMDWSRSHIYSTFHICWGAQAALYYHYQIPKYHVPQKIFGIFPHQIHQEFSPLLRGFDETFYAPHSRHTEIRGEDIQQIEDLEILSSSREAGIYILARKDGRQVFVTGHSEYDPKTLQKEYFRDREKGLPIQIPKNYFQNDNPQAKPHVLWRGHAHLLYSNWLNYWVYQDTPYYVEEISPLSICPKCPLSAGVSYGRGVNE